MEVKEVKKYEIGEKQLGDVVNVLQISLNTFLGNLMSLKEIKETEKEQEKDK